MNDCNVRGVKGLQISYDIQISVQSDPNVTSKMAKSK